MHTCNCKHSLVAAIVHFARNAFPIEVQLLGCNNGRQINEAYSSYLLLAGRRYWSLKTKCTRCSSMPQAVQSLSEWCFGVFETLTAVDAEK